MKLIDWFRPTFECFFLINFSSEEARRVTYHYYPFSPLSKEYFREKYCLLWWKHWLLAFIGYCFSPFSMIVLMKWRRLKLNRVWKWDEIWRFEILDSNARILVRWTYLETLRPIRPRVRKKYDESNYLQQRISPRSFRLVHLYSQTLAYYFSPSLSRSLFLCSSS